MALLWNCLWVTTAKLTLGLESNFEANVKIYTPKWSSKVLSRTKALCFVSKHVMFLWWGFVSTSLNPQAGGSPILSCLFNIFAATHCIWRLSPLFATWRHVLSWWQGSSYNGYKTKYFIKLGRFTLLQWPCLWCVSLVY